MKLKHGNAQSNENGLGRVQCSNGKSTMLPLD
jgi:hypothetical protein